MLIAGCAYDRYFGMCSRVVVDGHAVDTCCKNLPVLCNDSTKRATAIFHILICQANGHGHQFLFVHSFISFETTIVSVINCGRIIHIGTNLLKSFGFTNDSMQKNQKTVWHAFAFGLFIVYGRFCL